jgi:hypothetical protein
MSRSEPKPVEGPSVFVPSGRSGEERPRRWPMIVSTAILTLSAIVTIVIMVYRPALKLAPPQARGGQVDGVERVANDYLTAITTEDTETIKRLGTVEEPPAIRSVRGVHRIPATDRQLKGSFAPLGKLHARIASEYDYDSVAGRFTPKNAMGVAADTLDKLHEAKDSNEKSGTYKKLQSGDPEEMLDGIEQFAKGFSQLTDGILTPKKLVPTYKTLVQESKPPLPDDVKALALEVGAAPSDWSALLKRSFHTLKADGPFIFERAEVNAMATDRLASSGDPPTRLRLALVRFRLEGIDTGWKVISIRRVLPGDEEKPSSSGPSASKASAPSPGEPPRSLHDPLVPLPQ